MENMMKSKTMNTRISWIDVGKGIGILLVLLGHSFRDSMRTQYFICNYIYEWVYTFHMPFLMFLSGFTFMQAFEKYEKRGIRNFTISKLKRLIKPYVVYATLIFAIVVCCFRIPFTSNILVAAGYSKISVHDFLYGLITGENPYSFHLWYIYSLAIISVFVFGVLLILYKARLWMHFRVILSTIAVLTLTYSVLTIDQEIGIRIFSSVRGMLPWYIFGVIYRDLKESTTGCKLTLFVGILAIFGLGILPYIISANHPIFYRIVKYLLIAIGIVGLISVSKLLKDVKVLMRVGQESMEIYLFHQPFIAAGVGVITFDIMGLPVVVSVIITFILSLIVPLMINYLIKKARLTWIFF
ncbi:MAG: acyltransferase [Ruminococcus sp.]|nr:acyltransferase [Ruminococcus sp.]